MKRFAFRLERLLQWRTLEKEQEESRLQALFAEAERLESQRVALEDGARLAEESVVRPDVMLEEQQALGTYRRFVSRQRKLLAAQRAELEGRIEAQRRALVEAERKVEALNNMREEKRTAWRNQADKEQAEFVDGLVVARWRRSE